MHKVLYDGHSEDDPLRKPVYEIAVKKLLEASKAPEVDSFFNKELECLEEMRTANHPHLIQAIAAYTKGHDGRYFVFPWATKGNLRQLWEKHGRMQRDSTVIQWALGQIRGLAEGLVLLHKAGFRHGDLKPQNILVFDAENDSGLGSLVVADVGIAKYHAYETQKRQLGNQQTTNRASTSRYEPPEIKLRVSDNRLVVLSRRYDSWSLGCILLEFIIWLHYGWDELVRFNNERIGYDPETNHYSAENDRFWEDGGHEEPPNVHRVATYWIQRLHGELQENRSAALRDLLRLVENDLLVPAWELNPNWTSQSEMELEPRTRKYIEEILPEIQRIHDCCFSDPSYLANDLESMLTDDSLRSPGIVEECLVPISEQVSCSNRRTVVNIQMSECTHILIPHWRTVRESHI